MRQAELAYLPSDLGACGNAPSKIYFDERPNIAFDTLFRDLLPRNVSYPPTLDSQTLEALQFSINLTLPNNASESIENLKELHNTFAQNLSSWKQENISPDQLAKEYHDKFHQVQILIEEKEDHILSGLDAKFCSFLAFLVSLINMIIVGVMVKKFEKLQTITASLTLLRMAKAMSLQQLFNSRDPQSTEDSITAEYICYDPIISGVLTGISTLSVIIVIWQQRKNRNLCSGYLYSNIFAIKIVLGGDTRFLPLKLRRMAGPLHRVGINLIPPPGRIGLLPGWLWDSLTIDWEGIIMTSGEETIQLPNTIVVPLSAKFKVRQMISDQSFTVSMALVQNNNWHDLHQNPNRLRDHPTSLRRTPSTPAPQSPETRPLLRLVNTRISPVSEDWTHPLANMEQQVGGSPPPLSLHSPELTS